MSVNREHPSPFRAVRPGEPIRAPAWNHLVDSMNRLSNGISAVPTQVRTNFDNEADILFIRRFTIESVNGDYLTCKEIGITDKPSIPIARPPLLRRSLESHDGVSYTYSNDQTRVATLGGDSETQVMTPSYVADDIIFAISKIDDGTGAFDLSGNSITWQDLNVDARQWAKEAE
jgi:hypothetical protein